MEKIKISTIVEQLENEILNFRKVLESNKILIEGETISLKLKELSESLCLEVKNAQMEEKFLTLDFQRFRKDFEKQEEKLHLADKEFNAFLKEYLLLNLGGYKKEIIFSYYSLGGKKTLKEVAVEVFESSDLDPKGQKAGEIKHRFFVKFRWWILKKIKN